MIFQKLSRNVVEHLVKLCTLTLTYLVGNYITLKLLQMLNKKFKFIETIFIAYPASLKYRRFFMYDYIAEKYKWSPSLIGFLVQDGKLGLVFSDVNVEQDYEDPNNLSKLKLFYDKCESLR